MNDEEQIIETYHRMYQAMIEKDMSVLGEVLDEAMVLIHMTGLRQGKKSYMDSIADGTLNYFSEHTENIALSIDGTHATLTGQSRVEAAVYGGERRWWKLQLAMKLVKKGGAWKFTEGRASTYERKEVEGPGGEYSALASRAYKATLNADGVAVLPSDWDDDE